eukprot:8424725-Heterocapsa_arctica.AAC.1
MCIRDSYTTTTTTTATTTSFQGRFRGLHTCPGDLEDDRALDARSSGGPAAGDEQAVAAEGCHARPELE